MKPTKHKILTTWKQIQWLVSCCKQTKWCSFDFETNGVSPHYEDSWPTIISISFQPGSGFVIPLCHEESVFKDNWGEVLQYIAKELFEDREVIKVGQNIKFEHHWIKKYFLRMVGRVFDTMLAKYLLNEERPHGLKEMVSSVLPEFTGYDLEVSKLSKKHGWGKIPLSELAMYGAQDSDYTLRLMMIMEPLLIKHKFYQLFRNMLMQAHRVLLEAEHQGMLVNEPYLAGLVDSYKERLEGIENDLLNHKVTVKYWNYARKEHFKKLLQRTIDEIEFLEDEREKADRLIRKGKMTQDEYTKKIRSINTKTKNLEAKQKKFSQGTIVNEALTKKEKFNQFNFSSPKQLNDLLYNHKKGFECPVINRTDSGEPSTDEETLLKLKGLAVESGRKSLTRFIERLLEYRGTEKLFSTYIQGMYDKLTIQNRIHCSYLIHGTVTGRLCISGDSMLELEEGSKPIRDLCPQTPGVYELYKKPTKHRVLTHTGNYEKILYAINKGVEEMYRVTLEDGRTIECTMGHTFLTNHGWVPLRDIVNDTARYKIITKL